MTSEFLLEQRGIVVIDDDQKMALLQLGRTMTQMADAVSNLVETDERGKEMLKASYILHGAALKATVTDVPEALEKLRKVRLDLLPEELAARIRDARATLEDMMG